METETTTHIHPQVYILKKCSLHLRDIVECVEKPEGRIVAKIVKHGSNQDRRIRKETNNTLIYVKDQATYEEFVESLSKIWKDPEISPYEFRDYNYPKDDETFNFRFRIPTPDKSFEEMARKLFKKLAPLNELGIVSKKYTVEVPLVSREAEKEYRGLIIVKFDSNETEEEKLATVIAKAFLTDGSWDGNVNSKEHIYCAWELVDPRKRAKERREKEKKRKDMAETAKSAEVAEPKPRKKKAKVEKEVETTKVETIEEPKEKKRKTKKVKVEPKTDESVEKKTNWLDYDVDEASEGPVLDE